MTSRVLVHASKMKCRHDSKSLCHCSNFELNYCVCMISTSLLCVLIYLVCVSPDYLSCSIVTDCLLCTWCCEIQRLLLCLHITQTPIEPMITTDIYKSLQLPQPCNSLVISHDFSITRFCLSLVGV